MSWSCHRCGHSNPEESRFCGGCQTRNLAAAGAGGQTVEFETPRKAGLGAGLVEMAQQVIAQEIPLEEFQAHLEETLDALTETFEEMGEQVRENVEEEVVTYRDGVLDAVADVCYLFQAGIQEMMNFTPEDQGPLRVGRMLLEKGEDEYRSILRILEREAQFSLPTERERTRDLWLQMEAVALSVAEGETERSEFLETVSRAELAIEIHLEATKRDFRQALADARTFDGRDLAPLYDARQKALISLVRLQEFLGDLSPSPE